MPGERRDRRSHLNSSGCIDGKPEGESDERAVIGDVNSTTLSLVVFLAFLGASAAFLLLARLLSRDAESESMAVAMAIVAISSALLMALTALGLLLPRTPGLIHAGFAALVAFWGILRRTSGALGPPAPAAVRPAVIWWILGLPAFGLLVSLPFLVWGLFELPPHLVGLFQGGLIAAAWIGQRVQRRNAPVSAHAPSASPPIRTRVGSAEAARATATRSSRIFVCYRREDSADVTGRIYDRLSGHFGREHVFKDVDSIPLGVDFRAHLERVVGSCDAVVVVIGDRWLLVEAGGSRRVDDSHDFVRVELETALERQIPVVPVLVGRAGLPRERDLPPSLAPLAYRQGTVVRPDPDFHHDMDRLIEGLDERLSEGR